MKKKLHFFATLLIIIGFIPSIAFAEFWSQKTSANLFTNTGNGLGNAVIHVAGCVGCTGTSTMITGAIDINQIAFGIAPNTIGGSSNFFYDPLGQQTQIANGNSNFYQDGTVGNTEIKSQGITQFSVSNTTGIQQLGDIDGDWYSDLLKIDGPNRKITLQDAGEPYLSLDRNLDIYELGDISTVTNGSTLKVDNAAKTITAKADRGFAYQDTTGNQYILADKNGKQYGLGDLSNTNNKTKITIDDNLSTASIYGLQSGVILDGPTGPAGFDTPDTSTFTGTSPQSYHIDDQGQNGQVIENVTWIGGIPAVGDPVSGATVLPTPTGLVAAIDNTNPGTVYIYVTGGDFTGETTLISSFGGTIGGTISPLVDTYTSTINGVIQNPVAPIPMWNTSVPDINGLMLTWSALTYTPGSSWDFSLTFDVGKTFQSNGQAHTVEVGDVNAVSGGTKLLIDDANKTSSFTNRFRGGGFGGNVAAGANLKLGYGGNDFYITGGGTINRIQYADWLNGEQTILFPTATATLFKQNQSPVAGYAPMLMQSSSDFVASANCNITFTFETIDPVVAGPAFRETARSCP